MSQPKTRRGKKAPASAPAIPVDSRTQDIWRRTHLLIEVLMEVMEQGIRNAEADVSDRWVRLFGSKDSAVVNLQKLVQLLAELQAQATPPAGAPTEEALSPEEMALLAQWFEQRQPTMKD